VRHVWQPNAGVAAARNRALEMASGEIVAFLDSDDRWLPDHLEVVTEVLRRLPEAVFVTTSPRHVIGGSAAPRRARLYDSPFPDLLFANPVGYPSCIAVRRDAVVAAGGFDERLAVGEGADLFCRLALSGSFATLQRRTMVKGYTEGLREWGRHHGYYMGALEHKATVVIEQLRGAEGEQAPVIEAQARGTLAFVAALRGLERGDDAAVAAALNEACRLLPELSAKAELVDQRLFYVLGGHPREKRLRQLATAARLWPEPRSDTALYLRFSAAASALGAWRGRVLLSVLSGWPLRSTPGFLWRSLPWLTRHLRREVDAAFHSIRDGVDLDARPANRIAA
jgi:hypothetical protein